MLLSAAPVRIVKGFEPTYSTDADVSAAVEERLMTVTDRYVVNAEFQEFRATTRRIDEEAHPARQAGQWWRPLD